MPIRNVKLGKNVKIPYPELVNLYGCKIGDNSFIGPFVEVQKDVIIGKNCRIQSHTFVCSKVKIGNDIFIAHGVMFVNDKYPVNRAPEFWKEIIIEDEVVIGSNATILPCKIGKKSLIGAGAVVTKDIPTNKIVVGNPAKVIGDKK